MGVTDICPLFSILFHPKKLIHEVKKKSLHSILGGRELLGYYLLQLYKHTAPTLWLKKVNSREVK